MKYCPVVYGLVACILVASAAADGTVRKPVKRKINFDGVVSEVVSAQSGELILRRVAGQLAAGESDSILNVNVVSHKKSSVTVAPGATVEYQVIGRLNDSNNQGLALFGLDLIFDGGDLSQADTPKGEPSPKCHDAMVNFTIPWGITNPAGFGGTIIDGDLIQVGGGQNTINNTPDNAPFPIGPVLRGVAQPGGCGLTVLVNGRLTAPETEGVFTLRIANVFANVIQAGADGVPIWQTHAVDTNVMRELSITVSEGATSRTIGPR